ncbi:MAG: IS66 family transposase zinc-finger binding domain-containing protein [Bdellovibrionia bacterium]
MRENWELQKEIGRLTEQLEIYAKRLLFPGKIAEKVRIKDSQTSDQPPSWDHFKKPRTRSQREFTSRKPGGQVGHHGQTLNPVSNPGIIRRHTLKECPDCHQSLSKIPTAGIDKRQVFDLILPQLEVTEYQVERKVCPNCECQKQSEFPSSVKAVLSTEIA